MSDYPECDKLSASKVTADIVFEFLEWLEDQGVYLKKRAPDDEQTSSLRLVYQDAFPGPTNKAMFAFLGIDEEKLETERRAILQSFSDRADYAGEK